MSLLFINNFLSEILLLTDWLSFHLKTLSVGLLSLLLESSCCASAISLLSYLLFSFTLTKVLLVVLGIKCDCLLIESLLLNNLGLTEVFNQSLDVLSLLNLYT